MAGAKKAKTPSKRTGQERKASTNKGRVKKAKSKTKKVVSNGQKQCPAKKVKAERAVKKTKAKIKPAKSENAARKSAVKAVNAKSAKAAKLKKTTPLNIVFVASEAAPFVKTGGLADVVGSLPMRLKERGHNVIVFLPEYLQIHEANFNLRDTGVVFSCPVGSDWLGVSVSKAEYQGLEFFFIKYPPYFMRPGLYGEGGDYEDNLERFALFSKAVIEALARIGFKPDIIHCNDWHTGLIPVFLKAFYKDSEFFSKAKTIFSIHNIAYQGVFGVDKFHLLGLDWSYFTHQALEFYGKINLLKAGIVFADKVSTVSPGFAREIQTPDYGYGLDGVIRSRKHDLAGILNGIDEREWDPWNDTYIADKFGLKNGKAYLKGKSLCKVELLKHCKLKGSERPLFGVVSRLSGQKGIDILVEAFTDLLGVYDISLVLLGIGEQYYEQAVMNLQQKFTGKMKAFIKFDNELAHKIYAGSDFFLMPSKYEPCGISQMISMKYAAIPIVRACGGLKDTVTEDVGFLFDGISPARLKSTVEKAINLYYNGKKALIGMRKKAMARDFSWEASAKEYEAFYLRALK